MRLFHYLLIVLGIVILFRAFPRFHPGSVDDSADVSYAGVDTDILKYVDDRGTVRYVDHVDKIPHQFRSKALHARNLPAIGKVPRDAFAPAKSQTRTIEVYVTSWCGACRMLESELSRRKIPYTRYDIDQPTNRKRYLAAGGSGTVPLVKIGDDVVRGADVERIVSLARR